MFVAICQPHYLPWLGYFEMIDRVDCFVFLDHVDFCKRGWQNRNRIRKDRTAAETKWLSVPIERASQRRDSPTSIEQARIEGSSWQSVQLSSIVQVYKRAPNFAREFPFVEALLTAPFESLGELNRRTIAQINERLGIQTPCISSSELSPAGAKTDMLASILKEVGATRYLANNGSSTYLDGAIFEGQGVHWEYQNYEHPLYAQSFGKEALPWLSHLSVIDAMMNFDGDLLSLIRSGRPDVAQENRYAG